MEKKSSSKFYMMTSEIFFKAFEWFRQQTYDEIISRDYDLDNLTVVSENKES